MNQFIVNFLFLAAGLAFGVIIGFEYGSRTISVIEIEEIKKKQYDSEKNIQGKKIKAI